MRLERLFVVLLGALGVFALPNSTAAQERPWLNSLPIIEQSLELPETSSPDLEPACEVPEEFNQLTADPNGGSYAQGQYLEWVELFHKCRFDRLISSVERNLILGNPHPNAALIWASAQRSNGGLTQGWQEQVSPELLAALGENPEGYRLNLEGSVEERVQHLSKFASGVKVNEGYGAALPGWVDDQLGSDIVSLNQAAILVANPDEFKAWEPTRWYMRSDFERLKELLSEGGALADHFFAGPMRIYVFESQRTNADQIVVADAWLARHPNDMGALRFKAYALEGLGRYADAAVVKDRSFAVAPWFASTNMGRAYFRLEDDQKGLRAVSVAAQRRGGVANGDGEFLYAKALSQAGFGNAARDATDRALADNPQHLEVLRLRSDMERDIERTSLALENARKAWALPNAAWGDAQRLLNALRKDGRGSESLDLYEEAKARLGNTAPGLAMAASDAAEALGDKERALQILDEARVAFPHNGPVVRSMVNTYRAAGDHAKAITWSRKLLQLQVGSKGDFDNFYKSAAAINGSAGVLEAYQWAMANAARPEIAMRSAIGGFFDAGDEKQGLAIRQKARTTYPDRFWPVIERLKDPSSTENFARLEQNVRASFANYTDGEKEWAVRNLLFHSRSGHRAGTVSNAKLEEFAQIFEQTQDLMTTTSRFDYASQLYEALGKKQPILDAYNAVAFPAPENAQPLQLLSLSIEFEGSLAFNTIWRSLQRNRFKVPSSYRFAMEANSKWGGSGILAYCLGEWAEANFPEAVPTIRSAKRNALSRFGEDGDYFRKQYANGTSVSKSMRYVGWYHGTKGRALNGSAFVDLDCDRGLVTKVGKDGAMQVEQHNYETGKLALLAEGSSYVKYEYDDRAKLTRVHSTSGREIKLTYKPSGKIDTIADEKGSKLAFTYDESGKPSVIDAGEIGQILVEYDDRGTISKITSPDAGDNSGPRASLQVMGTFNRLLSLVDPDSAQRIIRETPEEFEASLVTGLESTDISETIAAIDLARAENFTDSQSMGQLDRLISSAIDLQLNSAPAAEFARFASTTFKLFEQTSPFGLAKERWDRWEQILKVAESRGSERPIAKFLADVRRDPLVPMTRAEWDEFDELRNPGYWYVDLPSAFVASNLRGGLEYNSALAHTNGNLIVGSNVGLLARRNGSWQRFVFSQESGGFVRFGEDSLVRHELDIADIIELPGGAVAVASNRGIIVLDSDLEKALARISTPQEGLPAMLVHDLEFVGSQLFAATQAGVARFDVDELGTLSNPTTVSQASARFVAPGSGGQIIAGGPDGVVAIAADQVTVLSKDSAEAGAYSRQDGRVILQSGEQLSTVSWDGNHFSPRVPLTNAKSARLGAAGGGLRTMHIDGVQRVVALGSEGYAIWQDGYFEHRTLPRTNGFPAVTAMDIGQGQAVVAASNGSIVRFDVAAIRKIGRFAVKASAYDAERDLVYFADPTGVQVALPQPKGRSAQIQRLGRSSSTELMDLAPDGSLIANDGLAVMRFAPGSSQAEDLFFAEEFCPEDFKCDRKISGLLAAADGSVWATKGSSAFRWKDGEVEEYSVFRDKRAFPSQTYWLAGIVQLPNGDIVVSASNERHLSYKGQAWTGQNLVFRNGKFEKFDNRALFTSNTNTEDATLVGSTRGFYEFDGENLVDLAASGDPAYNRLRDQVPNLYLAGEGAPIGDNTWLFPTPAGVVGYQNGSWFFPNRLNWQYPEPNKADIGGRHTYTLQVDRNGRIFAGTDNGMMIFQPLGGDAIDFLVENNRADLAFSTAERRKLQQEKEIFLRGIDEQHPRYQDFQRISQTREKIVALRSGQTEMARTRSASTADNASPLDTDQFAQELQRNERVYVRLLAELERSDPGLAQLLTIKPLELTALQRQIPEGSAVVQFIPQKDKLLLHVISKDTHVIRESAISQDALMGSAVRANRFLENQVTDLEEALEESSSIFADGSELDIPIDTVTKDLAGLYDVLVSPIELDINGFERIYVSAAGLLNYVPFSALRRERNGESQYAVERYNFAMVPTSYLLSLVLKDDTASRDAALVFGDPDGTLFSAQLEATKVGEQLTTKTNAINVKIGEQATIPTLEQLGGNSRFLHFATHGRLNSDEPENSYLVMAGGRRLSTIDIMSLNLSESELAFLSACQTALGREGLEFATLARAFSHAGVPTTIAGLWKVGDQATLNLATEFYANYDGDAMAALAKTQRGMIEAGGPLSHPAAWSSFQVFGRGWMPR